MPHNEPAASGQRVTAIVDYIDLTDASQGYTKWYRVPAGRSLVSVTIEIGSSQTWTSGTIIEPQWALKAEDSDDCFAVTYVPTVQFTSTVNSRPAIQALGRGYIRLKTTTAKTGDDPVAKVILDFF